MRSPHVGPREISGAPGVSYSFVNYGLFCDDFLGTGDGLGFVFHVLFMSLDLATFLFHFLASLRLREQ